MTTTQTLYDWCAARAACADGLAFVRSCATADDFWRTCARSDWMIWLIVRTPRTAKRDCLLRLAACDFAERVLPIYEKQCPGDLRPRKCIETARAFANGKASAEEMERARRDAAYVAAVASDAAANAAADAAYAVYTAAYAAYAADDAYDAARKAECAHQADIVRKHFPAMPALAGEDGFVTLAADAARAALAGQEEK